jgi:hypothetical protein
VDGVFIESAVLALVEDWLEAVCQQQKFEEVYHFVRRGSTQHGNAKFLQARHGRELIAKALPLHQDVVDGTGIEVKHH